MKTSILSLLAASSLAAALALPPAFAGAGHGPAHGGVVREVKNLTYELVAKPDSLTLHVSDHGKAIPTQSAKAEATLYAGSEKTTVTLAPAGDNRMAATGSFRVGVGVRAVVTVTLAGKPPAKLTFNLK
jgi:hypothetical protein